MTVRSQQCDGGQVSRSLLKQKSTAHGLRGEKILENAELNKKKAVVEVDRPWLAMSSMLIGAFVGMLSETSLNIALPTLGRVFSVETGTLQWLVTGYMLMIGIVLPFSSLISKWFSTRQIIIFALADFTVGALISGFANSFGMLLFGRMIQGIGTGLILPLMFTVAMLIFPPKKLGLAMGINALVIMFAPAIGPTVTGIVLGALSWRAVFFMFAIILLVGLLFAFIGLKNVSRITRPKIDLPSVLGSVIGFSSIVTGTSLASEAGWTSPRVLGLLAVGIIVLVLYAGRQLKLDEPVLNLRVFAKPAFRTGAILVMLDFGIILSAMYLMPQFIQNAMLLPVAMTGLIMLPGGIVNALVSAFAGRMYDRMGGQAACSLGLRHCPDRCFDVLFCRRKVVSCLCHRCSRCFDDRLSACDVTIPDACFECAGRSGICRRFNDHEHAAADRRRNCNGACDELSCDGSGCFPGFKRSASV